jgi:hypothetical protein
MKNLFRAATNWLNRNKTDDVEKAEPEASPETAKAKPVLVPNPAPATAPIATPVAKRERRVEEERESSRPAPASLASLNAGPEVKLFTRASKTYATCPHCEASWNLRERIAHPSFRRDESKGLTCPACDQGVSLPSTLDLRKLS